MPQTSSKVWEPLLPLPAPVHTPAQAPASPTGRGLDSEGWTPGRGEGGRLPSCLEDEAIGDEKPPSPHGGPRLPHSLGASLLTQRPAGHPGHPRLLHTRE